VTCKSTLFQFGYNEKRIDAYRNAVSLDRDRLGLLSVISAIDGNGRLATAHPPRVSSELAACVLRSGLAAPTSALHSNDLHLTCLLTSALKGTSGRQVCGLRARLAGAEMVCVPASPVTCLNSELKIQLF
jgi:hypothetical protein